MTIIQRWMIITQAQNSSKKLMTGIIQQRAVLHWYNIHPKIDDQNHPKMDDISHSIEKYTLKSSKNEWRVHILIQKWLFLYGLFSSIFGVGLIVGTVHMYIIQHHMYSFYVSSTCLLGQGLHTASLPHTNRVSWCQSTCRHLMYTCYSPLS